MSQLNDSLQGALQFGGVEIDSNRIPKSSPTNCMDSCSHHFWVATGHSYTSLLVVPPSADLRPRRVLASIFDSSGEEINTISAEFPAGAVGTLELDNFMHRCKPQNGMQHGHLVVTTNPGSDPFLRLLSEGSSSIMAPTNCLDSNSASFFPIIISDVRHPYICLVNSSSEPVSVAIRLFVGKRSPEILSTVPALGSRVVSLALEFPGFIVPHSEREQRCYIRVRARTAGQVSAQIVEIDRLDESGARAQVSSVS